MRARPGWLWLIRVAAVVGWLAVAVLNLIS
jgi:hypothetical protein